MRYIRKMNIKEGMMLASTIYNDQGQSLLNPNVMLSGTAVRRLKGMQIKGIYIYDHLSEQVQINEIIKRGTVHKAVSSLAESNYDDSLLAANYIVENLMDNIELLPDMASLCSYDNYTFTHSLNVAVNAALIAIEMKLCERRIKEVAAAGLLHDIGKTIIPQNLLNKKGALTPDEWALMKKHPRIGYEMLSGKNNIPSVVKNAVLFHHENHDGSGYPDGRKGESIHLYARILHVADVWDALITKRSYKDACCPTEAIAYIWEMSGRMFHPACVDAFRRAIYPYAPGVSVHLSDGTKGIVVKNQKNYPDRPDVIIEKTNRYISLKNHPEISITALLT